MPYMTYLISLLQQCCELQGTEIVIPIFQSKKLNFEKVKQLAHARITIK